MKFCDFLKEIRVAAGYTQKDIAEILKIDRSTYAYYESGKTEPNLRNLRKLANLYGMPVDDLIECSIRHGRLQFTLQESEAFENDYSSLRSLSFLSEPEKKLVLLYRAADDKGRFMEHVRTYKDTSSVDE